MADEAKREWLTWDPRSWPIHDPHWFAECPLCAAVVGTGGDGSGQARHMRALHGEG